MQDDAQKMFKKINRPISWNWKTFAAFSIEYRKPQTMVRAKQNFFALMSNPVNWKLVKFLKNFLKLAPDDFEKADVANIEQFL